MSKIVLVSVVWTSLMSRYAIMIVFVNLQKKKKESIVFVELPRGFTLIIVLDSKYVTF